MKLGMNHPMGPLTLADFIGLDTCLAIMNVLYDGFGDSKYRPCPLLRQYVAAGWLGKKSGRGFYTYRSTVRFRPMRVTQFEPTDDQRAIGALAREIAQREIAPHIAHWDREHTFPRALYTKLTDAGHHGHPRSRSSTAASAPDYVAYALAIEELARVDAGTARVRSRCTR